MKIYLAGSCGSEDRTMMMRVAQTLRGIRDNEVFCPFELKISNAWDMSQEEWAQKVFEEDTRAIKEADVVVLITPGRESTAGTNWEQGYAYALGKELYVFQITDKATSLMTYCGCNYFFNVKSENHLKGLLFGIFQVGGLNKTHTKSICETVLT